MKSSAAASDDRPYRLSKSMGLAAGRLTGDSHRGSFYIPLPPLFQLKYLSSHIIEIYFFFLLSLFLSDVLWQIKCLNNYEIIE